MDALDTLAVDHSRIEARAESDGRQQQKLSFGVAAAHVRVGVGLGVAQGLGGRQRVLVRPAALRHLGQDVVAGAVQEAVHGRGALGAEALGEGSDDGNAARDAGLEAHRPSAFPGGGPDFGAVGYQQRLVGSGHGLPVAECVHHPFLLGLQVLDAAGGQHLHYDVDVGMSGDLHRVRGEQLRRRRVPRLPLGGAREHLDHLGVDAEARQVAVDDEVVDRAAHGAGAEDADANLGFHARYSGSTPMALRMVRTACRVRCSFSIRAKRTCWSPYWPKPMPGDTATLPSFSRNLENSTDPMDR